MAHFTETREVAVPDNVKVIRVIGGGDDKIVIVAESNVDAATAKASGDDLGDNIKTAFA